MPILKPLKIGNIEIQNNIFLAPLAGIGDNAFRIIGKQFGAGLTFTEMVSAHGLVNRNYRSRELLRITRRERPCALQLFGANEDILARAIMVCSEYDPDIIDINAGCSVKKVIKTGSGANLLKDPDKFYRLIKTCVSVSPYPISVKTRLGLTEKTINIIEIAHAAEEAGVKLFTLHPRTASQGYSGKAKWEYIAKVKEILHIPVCGNGDIRVSRDAIRMVEQTGCDAVMVGRGVIGNPWLIKNIWEAFRVYPGEYEDYKPGFKERVGMAIEHLKMVVRFKGEEKAIKEVRRYLHRYLKGISNAPGFRKKLTSFTSVTEMIDFLYSLIGNGKIK